MTKPTGKQSTRPWQPSLVLTGWWLLNRDRELRFGMINLDEKGTYAIDY